MLVREGNKNRQNLPVRTYKIGVMRRNPGNRLIHSHPLPPEKKTLRARHASYSSARMAVKPRPQVPDSLPVSTYLAFWITVLVRRDKLENR